MERNHSNKKARVGRQLLPLLSICTFLWLGIRQYEVRHPGAFDTIIRQNLFEEALAADKKQCEKTLDREKLYLQLIDVLRVLNRFDDDGNDLSYLSRSRRNPIAERNESKKFIADLIFSLKECPDTALTIGAFPQGFLTGRSR